MLRRYLDVLVLSREYYYNDTPLLAALGSSNSIRGLERSRYSTELIGGINTLLIDPNVYENDEGHPDFESVRTVIESTRKDYPDTVVVLCSDAATINAFLAATGKRFTHYFQFDQSATDTAPDPQVNKIINMCQAELDGNIRRRFKYDIALSFAGEQRPFAEAIATRLQGSGASVFYDNFEQSDLWGQDLYTHLHDIYSKKAHYCVIFASAAYAEKVWTNHERQAAQERALGEKGAPYILPVRCDDSWVPGLSANIGYLAIEDGVAAICDRILEKIGAVKA
jgi:hypothetical protein